MNQPEEYSAVSAVNMVPYLQDLLEDVSPTVNSGAVENNISAGEVDCHQSTEKG